MQDLKVPELKMQEFNNTVEGDDIADKIEQYLTFSQGKKIYGIQITNIKEIIEYGEITDVPMTADYISGVINLRGRVVPVINLSKRFTGQFSEITKRTSIIIIEIHNDDLQIEIGVTVDMVNDVLDVKSKEIEPAPRLGDQVNTDFISGMAKVNGKLLVLLKIENILSFNDLSAVTQI